MQNSSKQTILICNEDEANLFELPALLRKHLQVLNKSLKIVRLPKELNNAGHHLCSGESITALITKIKINKIQ